MNLLDRAIAALMPGLALERVRARMALKVYANYDAATRGRRAGNRLRTGSDADAAAAQRQRLAFVGRDLVRNTAFASRAQQVIANNVVGDGIIWKVGGAKAGAARLRELLKAHLDTTAIDADGRSNLYGLQRLAVSCMVDSGEVLIRRRRRRAEDGLPLPFQLQILEPDYLDATRDGFLTGGGEIREGIEYDALGRRRGYWLFNRHPGAVSMPTDGLVSRFVPASEILHIYRQDRPGQMRGVTWFANVALALMDHDEMQDAQLTRQKIAACFAAFRVTLEPEYTSVDPARPAGLAPEDSDLSAIEPGRIQNLLPGEDIRFAGPPAAEGYDEFTRWVLRTAAAGLGITYEALTGDLSRVNFSSARMGRMEMDRNVSSWQWLILIPQMMQPLAAWVLEAFALVPQATRARNLTIDWVPPHRMLVDPTREIPAMRDAVRAGFASRQGTQRALGYDPEELLQEQIEDRDAARAAGLAFDSEAQVSTTPGAAAAGPDGGNGVPGQGNGEQSGGASGQTE